MFPCPTVRGKVLESIFNFSSNAVSNVSFGSNSTNIRAGNYSVTELLSNQELENLTINENGELSDWQPMNEFNSKTAYIFWLKEK